MSDIAIKAENVGKLYRLGQIGTGTLSHDLNRWWAQVRGKEDPFAKIGEANDRTKKGESDYVWALQDVDFEIKKGDAVGIIGRNGAGKSTLLKLLSKVTKPTTGSIKIDGRIASLLEVGTGFHPEMTGRENIYLNGAILGMRKREIDRKFDEIVDFSGVERYIDTPVKRYSSGMYVRLAFAVAAHLESEILIVDEVLAVGDAEFQKKCLGKMGDVSKGEGRTVLFVSHNMAAVSNLCTSGILLENGMIKIHSEVDKVLGLYISSGGSSNAKYKNKEFLINSIHNIIVHNAKGEVTNSFNCDDEICLSFKFNVEEGLREKVEVGFRVVDKFERVVFTSKQMVTNFLPVQNGDYKVSSTIPPNLLVPNYYKLIVALHIPNVQILNYIDSEVSFTIEETGTDFHQYDGVDYGCVFIDCKWNESTICF